MADFLDDEAEESEEEEEELDHRSKKKAKMSKAMEDSEEEEDDDEDRIREELKDLIDDNPIEESDGEDSDEQSNSRKRKKSGSVNYDDQLEDDDYELLEENLGITVDRKKKFKRLRRVQDLESDEEDQQPVEDREIIANQLFDGGSGDENERMSVRSQRHEEDTFDEAGSESHYSDADDFIVDNDGNPITEKRRQKRPVFSDATLQEAQDIFGVDFDYEEFDKYGDEEASQEEDEDDDEYIDDDERPRRRKKAPKQKTKKNTIFDIYEPSELIRGHFTDKDNEIRGTDIPERMQQRSVPITPVPEGSDELELEAEWIYKQAFCRPTISIQDAHLSEEAKERARKGPQTVPKIKKALDFMRNQNFEVPFISFYRKEYVLPELNINDLWKVYKYDGKWCELRQRKANLVKLFEHMRDYQLDEIMKNPDAPLPESMRVIKEEDIDRLKSVETSDELNDVYHHFMLYYSHEIPNMQEIIRAKNRYLRQAEKIQKRQQRIYEAIERGEDPPEDDEIEGEIDENDEVLKQAVRTGSYAICRKAGLHGLAKKFGLPPEHFAENVRDNYQRHDVEQDPIEPTIAALQYCTPQFNTTSEVLKAAEQMVAIELAREPLVRKCVREIYMERAKISVHPTKRGIKEIDENHPIYTMKYLKDKPVQELVGDQYLKLFIAERDKLITISLSDTIEGTTSNNYVQELKQLYHRDEFSKNVQDWNALRASSVEMALEKMILPDMQKELRANLLAESKEFVLRACCRKMYNWIKVAPYVYKAEESAVVLADNGEENWDNDWDNPTPQPRPEVPKERAEELDTSKGLRVMGIAYVPDFTQAAFACLIAPGGECTDHLRLPHLLKRRNSFKEDDKKMKEADLLAIRNFISNKKPHVIALGGESREAMMLAEDLKECITILNTDEQYPIISVEICENELAKIYSQSIKAVVEFKEYPVLLRQAISLARRLQDPLVEFSQLCTTDDEILCLKYHTYQDELPKEELLENLQLEFVNRVNEVGVDINKALQEGSLSGNLLQFVCGLGARKAQALVKTLKQTNQRIENRTQLVTICHMGPKVFINCAGFIKIDTCSLGDSTEAYVEVLDGSRVHPETYEWARKMAVDALEYDDEDANPAGALEDIFKCPDRLKDLDLDAFAEELERQGFGNKAVTLYDIRAELNCRYKDLRAPYESPSTEKLFDMLTKETPETFYIGKLITATVTGIVYKKPEGEQLDQANPLRNDETSLWQCPFCMKNDFPELSEVWGHFDAGECHGKGMGVRLRLDNGISGFIHIKNLSDKRVDNPEDRVRPGQIVHCRVIKIDVDRFSIECTSKSSELADKNNEMKPQRDPYYNIEAEEKDIKEEEEAKKVKQQRSYMKRVIVHPAFHNITYAEAAKQMASMKQGEVIIRPSSKGPNHLTVTWKVFDDILHHIDVREENKKFDFSLGEKLWIGTEEYEDLDEIIARHVNPMAAYASELLECNYYKPNIYGVEAKAEEQLKERKREKPSSIPCILSPSKNYPGKFLLSYLPRERCQHEYFTVTPDGVRYRGQVFPTIGKLFSWFKKHFREPREVIAPKTPAANTPGIYQGANDAFTPHHTLSLTADESPHQFSIGTPSIASAGGFGGAQSYPGTPYTPSGQTPSMTPWQTPGQTPGNQTPKWGEKSSNGQFARPNAPGTGSNYRSNFAGNRTSDWVNDSDRGRGRGRGRGNRGRGTFRGRGTANRGSYSRNNSFNDNFSNNFNSNTQKTGDTTPLWDESESWDSPADKSQNKANSNMSNIPKIGGQTPLWDESENWDSPGEATLPNDPRASKANSSCGSLNTPINTCQAPLWDESESWGSPPSESQKATTKSSYQTPKNRPAASSVPIIAAQAPAWDPEESWGSPPSESQQKSCKTPARDNQQKPSNFGSGNAPIITTQAPLWDASESWGSPPQTASQDCSGTSGVPIITSQVPAWDPSESWDTSENNDNRSMGPPISQPPRRGSYNNSSNFSSRGNRNDSSGFSSRGNRNDSSGFSSRGNRNDSSGFSSRGNRNDSSGFSSRGNRNDSSGFSSRGNRNDSSGFSSRGNRNDSSGFSSRGNRNDSSGFSSRGNRNDSSGFSSRGNRNDSRGGYRNDSGRGNRNDSRGGYRNNSQRGNRNDSWNGSRNWNSSGQDNSQNENVSGIESLSVPIIGTQVPLWDASESWDTDPVDSQVNQGNKDTNSQGKSYQQNKSSSVAESPFVPIIPTQAPLWDASESWDTDPVTPQANRANKDTNSRGKSYQQSKSSSVAESPFVPIIPTQAPLWDASESWDTDPVTPQANRANKDTNSRGKSYQQNKSSSVAESPFVPIIPTQVPMWDASESWDTDPVTPQVNRTKKDTNSRGKSYQQNKSSSVAESPFVPIIPTQLPLWDASESWDTDPVTPQVNRAKKDTNSQGKAYQQNKPTSVTESPFVPIIPTQIPLWDASESWDTDPVPAPQGSKPKQETNSQEQENTQSSTSSAAKPTIVSIVPVNIPLWNESESWDNSEPTIPKKNVPYQSSPSSYSNASSSYSNSSNYTPSNNRSSSWKPRQSWDSQGQGGNSRFGGQSGRNSSFQRGRGNQHNNSGRWNQNNNWNSSGPGNSRGAGGRGRFPPRQSRDMPENNSGASYTSSTGNNAPLWNQSESWDTPEPKTSKNESSEGKTMSTDNPQSDSASLFVPIKTNLAPLYNESESWD